MKCDELKQVENPIEWGLYYDKAEVDEAIAELKHQVWEADERAIDAGATSHEKMQECEAKDKEIAYLRRIALHALSSYPLNAEPLYVKIPRAEFELFKNAVEELAKTKIELAKANKLIKELQKHENASKSR